MRESLGKVSKKGTGTHIDLLSQEPDIVDDLCGLVHEFGGLVALPSEGESLDHPEGARDERSLFELAAAVAIQQWSRASSSRIAAMVVARWFPRSNPVRPASNTAASRSSVPAKNVYECLTSDQQLMSIQLRMCSASSCQRAERTSVI